MKVEHHTMPTIMVERRVGNLNEWRQGPLADRHWSIQKRQRMTSIHEPSIGLPIVNCQTEVYCQTEVNCQSEVNFQTEVNCQSEVNYRTEVNYQSEVNIVYLSHPA